MVYAAAVFVVLNILGATATAVAEPAQGGMDQQHERSIADASGSPDGPHAVIRAAASGDQTLLSKLISEDSNADLEISDQQGRTLLMQAAANGHVHVVQWLLKKGSAPDHQDTKGNTACNWAAMRGQTEVVKTLHDKGADLNITNHDDVSPLLYAVAADNQPLVNFLLKHGANPNVESRSNKMTTLLLAIEQNNLKMLDLLLSAGADANQSNRDGMTPLMAAQAKHQQEAITLLQKNGAVDHARSAGDPD